MQPADNLLDAIYVFDPRKPLRDEELKAFYVARQGTPLADMRNLLLNNDLRRGEPVRLLFTGHRGSGKSTELNQLAYELRSKFFIVPVPMRDRAPLSDLTYVDIVLSIASELFKLVSDQAIIAEAPAQILGDLMSDLVQFFEQAIFGDLPRQALPIESEYTAKLNLLAIEFQGKFKTEANTRATIRQRMENRLALIEAIEKTTVGETRAHWLGRLDRAGVPSGPINTYAEALADPHALARQMVVELIHPGAGEIKALGIPVKLSDTPGAVDRPAPLLGQHTAEILSELGYSPAEQGELQEKGGI